MRSDRKEDVIVIGGGVIGVAVAYYSALRGATVTVLEKGRVGHGSSYGNAGLFVPSHCNPLSTPALAAQGLKSLLDPEGPFYIRFRWDLELVRWIWRFYRSCNEKHLYHAFGIFRKMGGESLELHQQLAALAGSEYQFRQEGLLSLYISEEAFEGGRQDAAKVKSVGMESAVLSGDEVRELEPAAGPQVVGGVFCKIDGSVDPLAFVEWLQCRAEQLGVRFITDTEVFWLKTDRRRVTDVITTRGDFRAEQVVLANGAWMPMLSSRLGVRIPMEAAKGYSITFQQPEHRLRLPLLLEEVRVAVTPFKETLRLAGTLELSGLDLKIRRKRLNAIEARTYRYLPKLGKLEVKEIWRGFRPCTPDGLPVLGRLQPWSNVLIAGGHGTKGISLGPITGEYLSRILAGEAIGMLERSLKPNRF